AEKIADMLLNLRLIACAKFVPVDSRFHWEGKIEQSQEVMMLMESLDANFDKIEAEVANLHSYDTFVLKAVPITHISKQASAWLKQTLNGDVLKRNQL
ncbi:MAG: hypothetical protein JWO35_880, partial [Candidatus Saccharibacteria bacterium]|nr:hypothetical protein [Candidatus Saccharibacteria bacterium]